MTDASLYNGQTTDTISECRGARLTYGTLLTDIIKSGGGGKECVVSNQAMACSSHILWAHSESARGR